MKNILVTGGAGYIGSHTCKQLAVHGYTPVAYDNLVNGHRWAVQWGPLVEGDISDRACLDAALRTHAIDAVMHFAALASVGESCSRPDRYYRNNVMGTLTLLEAMRGADVGRIVFSSTAATYGTPEAVPMTEAHPQRPINPYGASKLMVERMLQDFHSAFLLSSVALRYFNAAGADPDGQTGEVHDPEQHLIPLALDAASGKKPLTVFGTDYPTPDGTCVRDYIHVTDLADAHVAALRKMQQDSAPAATAYNLGNGVGYSVRQVLDTVAEVVGAPVAHTFGPRRLGDPPTLVAASQKAKQELQWTPRYGALRDIVETAWRWQRSRQ